jgi:hypothetical protein
MDTSADRGRVCLVGAEDILYNEGYQQEQRQRSAQAEQQLGMTPTERPPRPLFPPRQGYFQRQREIQKRDMTKVQCFNCQGYRHISRYCTQECSNHTKDTRRPGPLQARAIVAKADRSTLLERANTWLRGVGGESEEVKNMILQMMWKSEDFPDT